MDEITANLRKLAEAEAALRRLGILRSRNIVGDLAEHVACERLGLARAPASTRGWDASDVQGRRVQIKGVRLPNRLLSILRDLDAEHFERLVVVVLDESYQLRRLHDFSRDEARGLAVFDAHQRGYRITLTAAMVELREAAAGNAHACRVTDDATRLENHIACVPGSRAAAIRGLDGQT